VRKTARAARGLWRLLAVAVAVWSVLCVVSLVVAVSQRRWGDAFLPLMGLALAPVGLAAYRMSVIALERGEDRLPKILNSMLDCFIAVDASGRIVEFNEASERTFGFSRGEVIGKSLVDNVIPPALRGRHQAGFARYLATGHSTIIGQRVELTGLRRDGSEIPIELTVNPLEGEEELMFTASIRELTELKRMEEQSRDAEARYKTLVERLPAITYIADFGETDSGPAQYVSPQITSILGFTQEEWLADEYLWTKQLHPEDRERAKADEARSRTSTEPFVSEYRLLARDGRTVWIRDEAVPVGGGPGSPRFFHGVMFDVTERKQLEQQLQTAQKMEALGRLAGGVAHDFNNLISVIINYASFLLEDLPEGDPRGEDVLEIRQAGERAARLVRQLLTFSRREVVSAEVMDLNGIVRGTEKLLSRVIGEDVSVELELDDDLNAVKVDPGQIEQVLVNLAVNARDAMPEGGRLRIETRNAFVDEAESQRFESLAPGSYASLTVSDTGTGMSEEVRTHLFEPFYTTKREVGGSGLGLATVYGIVARAGGHIDVDSEPGMGATFTILIPATRELAVAKPIMPVASPTDAWGETILVAEDEPAVRRVVTRILSEHGYKVLPATSGIEALGLSSSHSGAIDLLLTDVVMPHMSGKELSERIAASGPRLKTVYMSGYTDQIIARRGVLEEGEAFLQKPFGRDELVRTVREVLGG
jgi:two-component system cell cycle sensor histidine kinase/response regulator CckA